MRLSPSIVLLRTQTDERLTALAAEGSEPAFTALVERYRRMVLRACMRVLPESRAEDATQQVFVSAWKALTRGDDVRQVRPWLLRIARNTALNALRTPGFEYDELAESLEGGSAPQAELERRDVMRQTLTSLAALPENQREALLRSAVQGASHADIARDLGLSEGATRQLVLRARSTMRSAVSALTPLPLINWAASGSAGGVAEIAAGSSAAGASMLLAKAGAVAVIAGGAVATPAIVHKARENKPDVAQAAERAAPEKSDREDVADAAPSATAEPARRATRRRRHGSAPKPAARRTRRHGRHRHRGTGGPGPSHHGPRDRDDDGEKKDETQSNSGHGNGHEQADKPERDNSGHGNAGDQERPEPEDDHSGHGGGGGNSGHGGGHDEPAVATPTVAPTITSTPEPEDEGDADEDHSGHGGGDDED
jgi:RNA polymerase sigma factor (sigma-70 family)